MAISFILTLMIQLGISEMANVPFFKLSKMSTHLQADSECHKLSKAFGVFWGLPNGRESATQLQYYMMNNNISSVWLGIQRSSYPTWQWVNNKEDDRFKNSPGSQGCAVLGMNHIITPHECADESQGFICELPESTPCPVSAFGTYCHVLYKRRYWFRCKANNWFSARSQCHQHGGELSVMKNHQIKDILKPIGITQGLRCTSFYIGLHREYWLRTTDTGNQQVIEQENWAPNEPANQDCAIFTFDKVSRKWSWKAKDCFGKSQGLCEQYNFSYEETTAAKEFHNDTPCVNRTALLCEVHGNCGPEPKIWAPILAVMTITVVLVSAAALILHRRKLKKKEDTPTGQNEYELQQLMAAHQGNPRDGAVQERDIDTQGDNDGRTGAVPMETNHQEAVSVETDHQEGIISPLDVNVQARAEVVPLMPNPNQIAPASIDVPASEERTIEINRNRHLVCDLGH